MNWLDILILIVLIGSAIAGIMNGFIRSVLTLIGLIVGVILAGRYHENLAALLGFIHNENAARIVAFIIILAVVMAVASLLGLLFTKLVSAVLLGWANRVAGAVLGVIISAIVIAAILAVWVMYMGVSGPLEGSKIAPFLLEKFPAVLALLPAQFDSVRNFFR